MQMRDRLVEMTTGFLGYLKEDLKEDLKETGQDFEEVVIVMSPC